MRSLSRSTAHPVRHLAGLGLCWLLLVSGTVASARPPRPVVRPLFCNAIKRLGTDFLNDTTGIPEAWQRHDGAVSYDRLAAFQVFGLSDYAGLWRDVSFERKFLRIRPLHLPGDSAPLGKVYYAEQAGSARFYYKPPGQHRAARPILLSFQYRCPDPNRSYWRYFLLDVRNTRAPLTAEWEQIPPVDDVERFPDLIPDCPDFERLGIDYLADDREGTEARDTRSGTFSHDREAAFQLYGLGVDAAHDLDLTRRDNRLRVTLWTPPGSRPATGSFRFASSGGRRRIVYTPDGLSNQPRAAVITFSYRCGFHVHRRDFLLDIPPNPAAAPANPTPATTSCCSG